MTTEITNPDSPDTVTATDLTFTRRAWINAGPGDLYDLISDVSRIGDWSPNADAVHYDQDAGPWVGAWFSGPQPQGRQRVDHPLPDRGGRAGPVLCLHRGRRAGRNHPMGVVIHRPGNWNNGAAILASAPLRPGAGWHPLGRRGPARLHGRQRRIHIDQPRRPDRRAISAERAMTSPHTTQPDGAPDLRRPFLSRLIEVEAFAAIWPVRLMYRA